MSGQIISTSTMLSIGATGCSVKENDEEFGPAGHHLRWFYPAAGGYPAGGTDIWHLSEQAWATASTTAMAKAHLNDPVPWTSSTNWSRRDRHYPVHDDAVIITRADAAWKSTRNGLVAADRGSGATFVIHFNQPVVAVRLAVRRSAPRRRIGPDRRVANDLETVSVRHGARELDVVPIADEIVIDGAGITDLVVPNVIDAIIDFRFLTEVAAAEVIERNGQRRTHLDLPNDVSEAYELVDVELSHKNRLFTGSTTEKLKRAYPPKAVRTLIEHLHDTVGAPDHTVTTPSAPDQPSAEVSVLDHLSLVGVDPIVARMLACYWVDPQPRPGVYLIRADYDSPDKLLGFGFVFTRRSSDRPKITGARALQLPGIEYQHRRPRARVGVTFDGLKRSPMVERTVMVDIRRHGPSRKTWLTERRPHLVNSAARGGYTDGGLPVPETYRYEVTPIDIFGRQGNEVLSDPVSLVDLSRPTPPKHLVAAVAQHGAPWLNASTRSDRDRTGTLDATAEFGEAQLTVAPDAAEISWCWRSDPSDRDPSSWQPLAISKVAPPKTVEVTWKAGERVAEYPLSVASARPLDDDTMTDRLDRLDAVTRSAVDQIAPVGPMMEVLLQTALLEPDLFVGHTVRVGNAVVEVIGSTAGVGAADDRTDDARMTARLFLPSTPQTREVSANDVLRLRHPAGAGWSASDSTPPPLIHVPIPPSEPTEGRAEGGEVAIDVPFVHVGSGVKLLDHDDVVGGRIDTTIVGRVVSDHQPGRARSVLLRVRPDDAARLLQIQQSGDRRRLLARHHRPYVMDRQTLGVDEAAGNLQIDFAPEQRFSAIWVSAFTTDDGGLRSTQVAMPTEIRVVRPPPATRPQQPYPEVAGPNATAGELTPPDVDGIATVRLAWPPIDAGTVSDHVHYEVGRALASTIIATDRDRWFRGAPLATTLGATAGASATTATAAMVTTPAPDEPSNGTVRLLVDAVTAAGFEPRDFAGGRVILGDAPAVTDSDADIAPDTRSFHRLLRVAGAEGGQLELLIRPVVSIVDSDLVATPMGTTCVLEAAPSYEEVLADDERVRQLADLPGTNGRADDSNDRAFGLVTGTPNAGLRFVDRLPGIGRSRFFYKVRAVFPGETRSSWSLTSVGFHQLDTTAADPIVDVHTRRPASAANATFAMSFRLPVDPLVVGVRVRTLAADGTVLIERDEHLEAGSGQHQLAAARITSAGGIIDLSAHVGRDVQQRHADAEANEPAVVRLFPAHIDRAAPPADADLLPVADIGRPVVIGRDHDGVPLAIAVRQPDGSIEWIDSMRARHEVVVEPTGDVATVAISALKFVSVAGAAHAFHSEPVVVQPPRIGTADDSNDGDDDAND